MKRTAALYAMAPVAYAALLVGCSSSTPQASAPGIEGSSSAPAGPSISADPITRARACLALQNDVLDAPPLDAFLVGGGQYTDARGEMVAQATVVFKRDQQGAPVEVRPLVDAVLATLDTFHERLRMTRVTEVEVQTVIGAMEALDNACKPIVALAAGTP